MQKLLKYIILIGIFLLPPINSRITSLLWFSFSNPVSWNYEFTKVMFFNIWSSLVIGIFFIYFFLLDKRKYLRYEGDWVIKWLLPFYLILLISTFFSESPVISFLWNNIKSHSFLMWSNLIWLYIVFSSLLSLEKREMPARQRELFYLFTFKTSYHIFIPAGIFNRSR